jgi:hypothetical protein
MKIPFSYKTGNSVTIFKKIHFSLPPKPRRSGDDDDDDNNDKDTDNEKNMKKEKGQQLYFFDNIVGKLNKIHF